MKGHLLFNVPKGYRLLNGILTTFDFDAESFIKGIAEEDPNKFLVFRGDNLYENENRLYENLITKIGYPPREDGWPERYFHPKVALFRYENEVGERVYRLRIGSKNIYRFANYEVMVEFSGTIEKDEQPKNQPLKNLLLLLCNSLESEEKKVVLEDIINEIERVRFEIIGPYKADDFSFFTPSAKDIPLFKEQYDELLVFAPHVALEQLEPLLSLKKDGGRCIVVSNPSEVAELIKNEVLTPEYLSLPLEKYPHAKLYLLHKGDCYDLYLGSLNLTDYSVLKNDEAVVHLKGVKNIKDIPSFLSDFLSLPSETIKSELDQYEETKSEGFVDRTLSMATRLNYISHLLKRGKYEKEEAYRVATYLLSSKAKKDMEALLKEEIGLVPIRKIIETKGKERVAFSLPFEEILQLGLINHSLHSYDDRFSKKVYLHINGRGARNVFKDIHQDKDFSKLHLFRTDIHAFDPSMDEEVLLKKMHDLFDDEPEVASFLDRYIRLKVYKDGEDGPIKNDGPAQYTGLPLGGFLENVYLADFDRIMEKEASFYARCGDDILLGTTSKEKTAALAEKVVSLLKERKLELSPNKTLLVEPNKAFTFLGWKIENGEIDFTDEVIKGLERNTRIYAAKLLRLNKNRPYRLFTAVKIVNTYIENNDFLSSFKVVTVDTGLRKIDRVVYEFIRILGSGNRGKAKYRISHEDLQSFGYQTLVNSYYRFLKR